MTRYFYYIDPLDGNRLRRTETVWKGVVGKADLWGWSSRRWSEGSSILDVDRRICTLECILLIPEAM